MPGVTRFLHLEQQAAASSPGHLAAWAMDHEHLYSRWSFKSPFLVLRLAHSLLEASGSETLENPHTLHPESSTRTFIVAGV